jgi:hypothetical protein
MRGIIYSDVSCHLCTIKARTWWSSKFQIVEDDFSDWSSSHIVDDDLIQVVICDRFTFVLMFRFWFAFALSRSYHLCRLQNDQVFCQMISKRSSSLKSNFLNFISFWKFLFLIQFVHAKTTFSCDRKYYKERDDDRWWWSASDVTRFVLFSEQQCSHTFRSQFDSHVLVESLCLVYRDHHFLSVSLKLLCDMLVSCLLWRSSYILENALSLTINRSSFVSFSKNRRRDRRMLELRWDVETAAARSSQEDILIL